MKKVLGILVAILSLGGIFFALWHHQMVKKVREEEKDETLEDETAEEIKEPAESN